MMYPTPKPTTTAKANFCHFGTRLFNAYRSKSTWVELKATSRLQECHSEQAAKYMHLIGADDALVVNFTGTAFSHRHIPGRR